MDSHSAFQGNGIPFGCSTNHARAKACENLTQFAPAKLTNPVCATSACTARKRKTEADKREAKKPCISVSKMFQQWRQLYDRIGVKNSELAVGQVSWLQSEVFIL